MTWIAPVDVRWFWWLFPNAVGEGFPFPQCACGRFRKVCFGVGWGRCVPRGVHEAFCRYAVFLATCNEFVKLVDRSNVVWFSASSTVLKKKVFPHVVCTWMFCVSARHEFVAAWACAPEHIGASIWGKCPKKQQPQIMWGKAVCCSYFHFNVASLLVSYIVLFLTLIIKICVLHSGRGWYLGC